MRRSKSLAATGKLHSEPGMNKAASPNKAVILLWHTTALLWGPYNSTQNSNTPSTLTRYLVISMKYKALRSAGGIRRPLRSLRMGVYRLREAVRGPRLIVRANWRVDNANSPAAMLQENSSDATCMSIPGTVQGVHSGTKLEIM